MLAGTRPFLANAIVINSFRIVPTSAGQKGQRDSRDKRDTGQGQLAVGGWRLAVGSWQLAEGAGTYTRMQNEKRQIFLIRVLSRNSRAESFLRGNRDGPRCFLTTSAGQKGQADSRDKRDTGQISRQLAICSLQGQMMSTDAQAILPAKLVTLVGLTVFCQRRCLSWCLRWRSGLAVRPPASIPQETSTRLF